MPKVFISHAVADKPVIDLFVPFVRLAHNLDDDEVFCTVLDGYGIPNGKNFVQYITENLLAAKCAICLISPNYLASKFCLNELGAIMALDKPAMYLIVPPAGWADMEAMLAGLQGEKINDESHLAKFRDELDKALEQHGKNTAVWQTHRNEFLKGLKDALANVKSPEIIQRTQFEELKKQKDDLQAGIEEALKEQKALMEKYDAVSKLKDKEEVAKVEAEAVSDEWERLKKLMREVRIAMVKVRQPVRDMFYSKHTGHSFNESSYREGEVQREEEEHFLRRDAFSNLDIYPMDVTNRGIRQALDNLTQFLENTQDFIALNKRFEQEYQLGLDLDNKRVWNKCLGLDGRFHFN